MTCHCVFAAFKQIYNIATHTAIIQTLTFQLYKLTRFQQHKIHEFNNIWNTNILYRKCSILVSFSLLTVCHVLVYYYYMIIVILGDWALWVSTTRPRRKGGANEYELYSNHTIEWNYALNERFWINGWRWSIPFNYQAADWIENKLMQIPHRKRYDLH